MKAGVANPADLFQSSYRNLGNCGTVHGPTILRSFVTAEDHG